MMLGSMSIRELPYHMNDLGLYIYKRGYHFMILGSMSMKGLPWYDSVLYVYEGLTML